METMRACKTCCRLHAALCAAGYNIRWLLRMIARKGTIFLPQLHFRLCTVAGLSSNLQDAQGTLLNCALANSGQRLVALRFEYIRDDYMSLNVSCEESQIRKRVRGPSQQP